MIVKRLIAFCSLAGAQPSKHVPTRESTVATAGTPRYAVRSAVNPLEPTLRALFRFAFDQKPNEVGIRTPLCLSWPTKPGERRICFRVWI